MKISCTKSELLNGINNVSKAVSTKSTMSIVQCILIESSLSEIRLIGNDTELGIETIIDGTIKEAGKIALDAKLLGDIVRKLPDSEVLTLPMPKGRGFLVAAENRSADRFISDRSYPRLGLCH